MENIKELLVHFLETLTTKTVMRSKRKFFVYSLILKTINSRDPLHFVGNKAKRQNVRVRIAVLPTNSKWSKNKRCLVGINNISLAFSLF